MSPDILFPFIYVLAHTGARLYEIRILKCRHINFDANHIYVAHTKNGYEIRIPLTEKLSTFLMELKNRVVHKSEYLFLNQWGTLLSKGQIRDTIIKYQKLTKCTKRWTPHDLRHSFAHNYLKKGGQMYALQALLGQRSITMTINHYGQIKATDVEMVNPYY